MENICEVKISVFLNCEMPRSQASRFIFPDNELVQQNDILTLRYNLTTLAHLLSDENAVINWCARNRLISNSFLCTTCQSQCGIINRKGVIDGKTRFCLQCKKNVA